MRLCHTFPILVIFSFRLLHYIRNKMDEDVFESQVKKTERSFEEEDVLEVKWVHGFSSVGDDIDVIFIERQRGLVFIRASVWKKMIHKWNIFVSFEVKTTDISSADNFKKLLCNGTLALAKVLNKFYNFFTQRVARKLESVIFYQKLFSDDVFFYYV